MRKDKQSLTFPRIKHWREEESRIPMMRFAQFEQLNGAPEYRCNVRTPTISADRFLCRVVLHGYDEPDVQAWVDTTTGTFYGMDGRCMSGPLHLHGKPVLTGRNVPSKGVRVREGEGRAAVW